MTQPDELDDASDTGWAVVVNNLRQYSVWSTADPIPAGWTQVGQTDTRDSCLDRIAVLWTDITPVQPLNGR